jgi:hypothetical protein
MLLLACQRGRSSGLQGVTGRVNGFGTLFLVLSCANLHKELDEAGAFPV